MEEQMQNVMHAVIVDERLMLPRTMRSNEQMQVVLQSIGHWLREMAERAKPERFLCLDCDTTFHARRMPDAFAMAIPVIPEKGKQAWITGVCWRCADKGDAALLENLVARMRAYYPDLTIIQSGQA
jgi:hypothetical protein